MARLSQLIGAALLALSGASAHAFVFPAPPPGFAGTPGNWTYAPPSGTQVLDKIMRAPPSLTVPTGSAGNVKLPFAAKLGPTASRVAAGVVFANPQLRLLVGIATWLGVAGLVWDAANNVWRHQPETEYSADGKEYSSPVISTWHKTYNGACSAVFSWFQAANASSGGTSSIASCTPEKVRIIFQGKPYLDSSGNTVTQTPWPYDYVIKDRPVQNECPDGWTPTPAGCLAPQVDKPKFEELLDPLKNPMPDSVPLELPFPTPLPVHDPVVNPTPGPNPTPQPKFVPTGDPVKNPNYDPKVSPSPTNQPYIQPGIRIQPSPTPTDPWRVDVQPVNRPLPTDNPNPPDPEPGTDPGDQKKPEETQSLCEKHPDILACQKLDQPEAKELAKEDINISITPVSGWGAENAACPAPRAVQVAGRAVEISWQPVCDFATGLRPLVIALAWLSAVSMVIVVARRN